jgi:polyisoprenoid-binding protein YceI
VNPEATLFEITTAESEVRFTLDELLRGQPKKVVGGTNQVAGQIALDPTNLATTQVGTIQIEARTFYTDNEFRNEALNSFILASTDFPFISFEPTAIRRLPETIVVGETAVFDVSGDLTIRDVTRPITFAVTAVLASPTRLEGSAATSVNRTDFGLVIPNAPGVADVAEVVLLEVDFVATAVNGQPAVLGQ